MPSSERIAKTLPWGLLLLALLLPVGLWLRGPQRDASGSAPESRGELPDYGLVPDFSLVERSGRPLGRADLAGAPWFADFVFTRCSGTCPLLSARMAELQRRVGDGVRLVSISVDPAYDTPAVLSEYAGRFGASPDRWLFVTGEVTAVRRLVAEGFRLSVVQKEGAEGDGAITHSDRIALIDRDLRIRRHYIGTEKGWIEEALRDLERLRE